MSRIGTMSQTARSDSPTSVGQRLVQPAAQEMRHAAQAAVHLPDGQRDRPPRRHGEGLRVREGPVRDVHARRAQGARGEATGSIDIAEFVPLAAVDPVYFDRPYYLGPEKGGDKAYLLLAEAMRESGRAALARYAARGKQYLVMLRPTGGRPRAGAAAAAVRRRGAVAVGRAAARRRGARAGAEAGEAADRSDRVRDVRSDAVPRRGPGANPGRHREEGAGPGHHARPRSRAPSPPASST